MIIYIQKVIENKHNLEWTCEHASIYMYIYVYVHNLCLNKWRVYVSVLPDKMQMIKIITILRNETFNVLIEKNI